MTNAVKTMFDEPQTLDEVSIVIVKYFIQLIYRKVSVCEEKRVTREQILPNGQKQLLPEDVSHKPIICFLHLFCLHLE